MIRATGLRIELRSPAGASSIILTSQPDFINPVCLRAATADQARCAIHHHIVFKHPAHLAAWVSAARPASVYVAKKDGPRAHALKLAHNSHRDDANEINLTRVP